MAFTTGWSSDHVPVVASCSAANLARRLAALRTPPYTVMFTMRLGDGHGHDGREAGVIEARQHVGGAGQHEIAEAARHACAEQVVGDPLARPEGVPAELDRRIPGEQRDIKARCPAESGAIDNGARRSDLGRARNGLMTESAQAYLEPSDQLHDEMGR